MPKINLWDFVGTGLIIEYPSRILISNQTGGTSCLYREMEGVFVPFYNECPQPQNDLKELSAYFEGPPHHGTGATNGLTNEDAAFLDRLFTKYGFDQFMRLDRSRLKDSHEAWVFVQITNDGGDPSIFDGFETYPRKGVFTWFSSG